MPDDPAVNDVLDAVAAVDWPAYTMSPATSEYRPAEVAKAFQRLLSVSNERDSQSAYNTMMNAIGHNHSGWLYAAAVPAVPLLVEVAAQTSGWVRRTALDLLNDCLWFAVAGQQFLGPDGSVVRTREAIRKVLEDFRADLEVMAGHQDDGAMTARAAQTLLQSLDEEGQAQG